MIANLFLFLQCQWLWKIHGLFTFSRILLSCSGILSRLRKLSVDIVDLSDNVWCGSHRFMVNDSATSYSLLVCTDTANGVLLWHHLARAVNGFERNYMYVTSATQVSLSYTVVAIFKTQHFWTVIESFSAKKKDIYNPKSNPVLSCVNLSLSLTTTLPRHPQRHKRAWLHANLRCYNYLISGMPEYTIVFLIKNAITTCYKIKKEKKRERNSVIKGNKNRSRSHDWRKKAPKPCEVLQRFFAELNESMKLLRSEHTSTRSGKNLPIMGSQMWYVFDFSWKLL